MDEKVILNIYILPFVAICKQKQTDPGDSTETKILGSCDTLIYEKQDRSE